MINKKTYKILQAIFTVVVVLGAILEIGHITRGWLVMALGLLATTIAQSMYIKHLENFNTKE